MAKIDLSKIAGYAEMTAEEKLAALEGYEFVESVPDNAEATKLKASLSKANSEAAEYKRLLREKQTEQERAEAERIEAEKTMAEELAAYKRRDLVHGYESRCRDLGYDAELANKTAEAMADGRFNEVFEYQQEFLKKQKEAIEAEAMNRQPSLTPGIQPSAEMAKKQEQEKLRKYFGL